MVQKICAETVRRWLSSFRVGARATKEQEITTKSKGDMVARVGAAEGGGTVGKRVGDMVGAAGDDHKAALLEP